MDYLVWQYCGCYVYYPIEEETKTTYVILLSVIVTLVVMLAIFIYIGLSYYFNGLKGILYGLYGVIFIVQHPNK